MRAEVRVTDLHGVFKSQKHRRASGQRVAIMRWNFPLNTHFEEQRFLCVITVIRELLLAVSSRLTEPFKKKRLMENVSSPGVSLQPDRRRLHPFKLLFLLLKTRNSEAQQQLTPSIANILTYVFVFISSDVMANIHAWFSFSCFQLF